MEENQSFVLTEPWHWRDDTNRSLAFSQQFDREMLLASLQHVEWASKRKLSHDIETIVVEPQARIEWLSAIGVDLLDQNIGEVFYSWLVCFESYPTSVYAQNIKEPCFAFDTKSPIPHTPSLIVQCTVSALVHTD